MTDVITGFFTDPSILSMIVAFLFIIPIFVIALWKKIKLHSLEQLIIFNFALFFLAFLNFGISAQIYVLLFIFLVSGLGVVIANQLFLGTHGENKIFMAYLIFLSLSAFLVNVTATSSSVFSTSFGSTAYVPCSFNLVEIVGCGVNLLTFFGQFFNFSSTLGIINIVIFLPFIYFIIKYLADWFRGRGTG